MCLAEQSADAERVARKAARKAAKLAASPDVDADELAAAELEASKAARKAEKKVAKLKAAEEQQVADDEEAKKAAKAARKAEKAAKLAAAEEASAEGAPIAKTSTKRKADRQDGEESDSTVASVADKKRRKDADGSAVATKILGPSGFRAAHQIVADAGCPDPLETFDAAAPVIGAPLMKALRAQGYASPTPIQSQGWPVALQGQDVVAVAKTGSGKTCGFLLPVLVRLSERGVQGRRSGWNCGPAKPTCLVLAPTRELAQQIAGEAVKFAPVIGARVVVIYGGVAKGEHVRELKAGADILIATPGRLLDLAAGSPERGLPPAVLMEDVNYLVLDEADRMLDMGFEPDIRKIADQCKPSGRMEEGGGAPGPLGGSKRQTLFFTATWPKNVQRTARSLTSYDALNVSIGQGAGGDKLSANPMVKQTLIMIDRWSKGQKFHDILKAELGAGQTCIVFCGQKNTCDTLEAEIQRKRDHYGFTPWCRAIHSGREQWDRDEALAQFRAITAEQGERRGILVATDVAARGLDIPGVAMVFVYDFGRSKTSDGSSVESYVHRIGRTGRAGKSGKAFAFFTSEDSGACELVEVLQGAGQEVPPSLKELGDAEWYKNMEKENKKNRYRKGGKGGGKGGKGSNGGKGGFGKSSAAKGKAFGGRGGGKS